MGGVNMSNVKRLLILGIAAGLAFSVVGNTAAGFNLGKVLNKVGVSTTESSEEPLYEGEPADGTRENGMVYNAEVHGWYDEKTGALLSRNDAEARRMPAPPGPTTAKCDLIYGIVKAGREDLEVRLENNLLILKTRGSLWDGGTGEKGEISIILPEECKKGVVYKPKADHYFTFDKPNKDGPVTLVRHEGYVIGFDTER
jgi:putative transcriptional regulator